MFYVLYSLDCGHGRRGCWLVEASLSSVCWQSSSWQHQQSTSNKHQHQTKVWIMEIIQKSEIVCSFKIFSLVPVNVSWGAWSDWSNCSKSCDGGTEERNRSCLSPSPDSCQGKPYESRICNIQKCKILYSTVQWEVNLIDQFISVKFNWSQKTIDKLCSAQCSIRSRSSSK